MNRSRFVLDDECQQFLSVVRETAHTYAKTIKRGSILYRAAAHNEWARLKKLEREGKPELNRVLRNLIPSPAKPRRMLPLPERATEGRVNPKGIPCLYLATDAHTAMSEMRQWIGSYLTVGEFRLRRQVEIVDMSVETRDGLYVWYDIGRAFSRPVARSDDRAEYAPTQFIAEAIRAAGFDGILYRSAVGEGSNVALFDIASAKLGRRTVHEVRGLRYEFLP